MTGPLIIAARRSPVAPRGGGLAALAIHQIAAPVISALLADAGIAPGQVGELILGNALGAGGNPARLAALAAGLPERVAGLTIDRQCCGGMDAVLLAHAMVAAGLHDVVIAGGAESYSRRPLRLAPDPQGGPPVPYDQPPFAPWPDRDPDMTQAAEAIAARLGISRAEQDDWAVASHARALTAAPRLAAEIVPMAGLAADSFARALTLRLCARAPVLAGSVTAANTAVAADGAAFCLVVSDRIARHHPALRILAGATVGADPALPGLAPVPAIRQVLDRAGLAPDALDVVEMMEAFAVQAIGCLRLTGLPMAAVNQGGGALARGHPVGASGAINLVRLFHDLRAPGQHGLAAIAAAGGLGTALLVQRVG